MTKLRLGPIADDKPVRVTVELPAAVHRDLATYAELLARETGGVGKVHGGGSWILERAARSRLV